ncbi:hypothetical protein M0638_25445 [Roseomonas sp. NAR14]|uniref:Uncharacterized protein n=1 Tax=Roseomonas acroporae TaxID=2937791 RepID=A0A9X1YBH8_9PROT|nr:hypothetical protein [Roseomonas acroporae]MCK8787714.1 hypothetical protein [Roseomonas acroporae]
MDPLRRPDPALIAVCLLACLVGTTTHAAPAIGAATGWAACRTPSNPAASPTLGQATMRPDGTIVLDQLRFEGAGGVVGHPPPMVYPPGHQEYAALLRHLGGLRPGEGKPIPPCE